jgi:hypothetical protein
LSWVLAFKVEPILLVHPLDGICTLKTSNAPTYIVHMKRRRKDKKYILNIVVVSVTNLVASYLQLFPRILPTILT